MSPPRVPEPLLPVVSVTARLPVRPRATADTKPLQRGRRQARRHLRWGAIEGFEAQKVRLETQIADLRQMLDRGSPEAAAAQERGPVKRKVSAAARRRMALGQKKRWAAIKGESEPSAPAPVEPPKPKRR